MLAAAPVDGVALALEEDLAVPVPVPEVVAVPLFVTVPVPVVVALIVPVVMVEFEVAVETTVAEDREDSGTWIRVVFTPAGMEGATVTTAGWVVTGLGCDVAGVVTGRGWEVMTAGWLVMTPRELDWARERESARVSPNV